MPDQDSSSLATSKKRGRSLSDELRSKAGTSRKVSWLLDECIKIPGTKIRFGLDPILGLMPYGGETVATIIGAIVLGEAGKKGLPLRTIFKMSGNMILNATVGVFPVAGDIFSFWFKSNTRNYQLLNAYLEDDDGKEAEGGWWPLLIVVGVIGFVIAMNIAAWIMMMLFFSWILKEFSGS